MKKEYRIFKLFKVMDLEAIMPVGKNLANEETAETIIAMALTEHPDGIYYIIPQYSSQTTKNQDK